MFDKDFVFYGKHANYAQFLCKDKRVESETRANVFETLVDLMLVAPLFGVIYGRYVPENDKSVEGKASVQLAQISSRRTKLTECYRLVMLANYNGDYTNASKIDQAFRHDLDRDIENPNMKIFESYMRGGIEYLYEKFKDADSKGADKKYYTCGIIDDLVISLYDEDEEEELF